ncbi:Uncharacterised protein [Mycobacterium tuberculosis]|nr:Uncharacterised protein [Mycobacterium tuberculosis]
MRSTASPPKITRPIVSHSARTATRMVCSDWIGTPVGLVRLRRRSSSPLPTRADTGTFALVVELACTATSITGVTSRRGSVGEAYSRTVTGHGRSLRTAMGRSALAVRSWMVLESGMLTAPSVSTVRAR